MIIEIVDFPMKNGGSFHSYVTVYQRVYHNLWVCLKMLCTPKPNGFADHYPYFFMAISLGI